MSEAFMRSISDTISRLNSASGVAAAVDYNAPRTRLEPLSPPTINPGALKGWVHIPPGRCDMALVVVLHGCTQNAAGYDHGAGWSDLADRFGFALLFPEQQRANNANLCFNWFSPEDIRRDSGEAFSIRNMVSAVVDTGAIDPGRIFVTGLSAGGAMTSAMLATYPEVFAGGAIIAGLPYAAADSVPTAFERMRGLGLDNDVAAGAKVRRASHHHGPWPRVAVWHGDADRTVNAANADAVIGQWRTVHGAPSTPDLVDAVDGRRHRVWRDAAGRVCIEDYRIVGMGHGTPIRTDGETACGTPMPFMLDVGISSTWHIARNWGLLNGVDRTATGSSRPQYSQRESSQPESSQRAPAAAVSGIQQTIENALRSAGLMR